MTDHEAAELAAIRLKLDELLAGYHMGKPLGVGTGGTDLRTFPSLAEAQACAAAMGVGWTVAESGEVYTVVREVGDR